MSARGTLSQEKSAASSIAVTGASVGRRPASLASLSGQLLGCVFLPQGLHVQVALALGELAPVRRDEQRRVCVLRRAATSVSISQIAGAWSQADRARARRA